MHNDRSCRQSRAAFTLVELMFVLLVITILAALSLGGYVSAMRSARRESTRTLVQTLNDGLQMRMEAFFRANPVGNFTAYGPRDTVALGDLERQQLIWRLDRMRSEFPQEFGDFLEDCWGGSVSPNPPSAAVRLQYIDHYNKNFTARAVATHNAATESSECLYMILKYNNRDGISFNFDNLPPGSVQDTDGDGLLEFVDAWNQPLRFYRWPVDLMAYYVEIDKSLPSSMRASNFDTGGVLIDGTWFNVPTGGVLFENGAEVKRPPWDVLANGNFNPDTNLGAAAPYNGPRHRYFRLHQAYTTPPDPTSPPNAAVAQGYPLVPMIISAGGDGAFGFVETPPTPPLNDLAVRGARIFIDPTSATAKEFEDDIVSLKLRQVSR